MIWMKSRNLGWMTLGAPEEKLVVNLEVRGMPNVCHAGTNISALAGASMR
jgi:hypothetical protein